MMPKERVMRAIEHKEVDRVPLDIWIVPEVTEKMCSYLGLNSKGGAVVSAGQHIVSGGPEPLLQYLGIDLRWITSTYIGPPLAPNTKIWGTPTHESYGTKIGSYSDTVGTRPLRNVTRISQLDEYSWPDPSWWDHSKIEDSCEAFDEYAVVLGMGTYGCNVFSTCCDLFGLSRYLTILYRHPDLAHAVIDRLTDFYIELHRDLFEASGGKAQIVYMWDDFAHQKGLFMSVEKWVEFFKPPVAKFYRLAKKHNLKALQHVCGAMKPLIPELVELGMDILNPIQVRSPGMNLEDLKTEFGEKISFHGAIDVQHTLPFGTSEDVKREARQTIKTLGKNGGYILASSHTLLPDIPTENILAMYTEAKKPLTKQN